MAFSSTGLWSAMATPLLLPGGGENCCVSEQVYIDSAGNEKKILFLLCIGLRSHDNEQPPLFSLESEPWSLLSKTSFLCPKNSDYVNEITRRARLFNIVPVPSNYKCRMLFNGIHNVPVSVNCICVTYSIGRHNVVCRPTCKPLNGTGKLDIW
jgi:hypothetical protein